MKKELIILFLFCSVSVFGQIETTTSKDCYIVYDFNGKEFLKNKKIKAGTKIIVFEENKIYDTFYHVRYKNIDGCLKENCISVNSEIDKLFQIKKDRMLLAEKEKAKNDSIRAENAKIEKIEMENMQKRRYGRWYDYVNTGKVVIGMPERFIKDALGKPQSITETESSNSSYTIYDYGNMYIHTSNGKIIMIQKSTYN